MDGIIDMADDRLLNQTRSLFGGALVFIAVLGLLGTGCRDSIGEEETGTISVQPLTVSFARIADGETATQTLTIRNTDTAEDGGTLAIQSIELGQRDNLTTEGLRLANVPEGGSFDIPPQESREVQVEYTADNDVRGVGGAIRIENSDPNYSDGPLVVDVSTLGNNPDLRVSPDPVRFPRLPAGETTEREVDIRNDGQAPLMIYEKPRIEGSEDYILSFPDDVSFEEGLELAAVGDEEGSSTITGTLEYRPTESGSDTAEMIINSNEEIGSTAEDPTVTRVDISANADAPCILVDNTKNFGAVPLGGSTTELVTVENCGNETLRISDVELAQNSDDDEFSIDLRSYDGNGDGELDSDIQLEPGSDERASFAVKYEPTEAGTDNAQVVVRSNDPVNPAATVDVIARGSEGACPETELVAKVKGASAAPRSTITAAPLDYVVLDGSGSSDEDGTIESWSWEVLDKPEDVSVRLEDLPSEPNNDAKRQMRLLTAGTYRVGLTVKDNDGFSSCEQGVAEITAVPNEKVHVELTWTNPKDPDETDTDGSDVDVHMVKMMEGENEGVWFGEPYDIYFRNQNSGDANIWNPESPSLDIDDTDGAGPENIQMDDPQNCQWYAVGAQYWEKQFGTAYVTVRIYINSNLVFEALNQPLRTQKQFWDVARIHWPTGQVYRVDELYPTAPRNQSPTVPQGMSTSDLCTAQNLY
jgi:hypothetical protein